MKILAMVPGRKQHGAATVEFALIATIFFGVLFGIVEFGRGLYLWNSIQEVTRYVAREAVVCWRSDWNAMRDTRGMMGLNVLPAAPELTNTSISIQPLRRADKTVLSGSNLPGSVDENSSNCMKPDAPGTPQNCIGYVRVTVNASFTPLIGTVVWFPLPDIPLPLSSVVMPAESLGFMRSGCAP